MTDMAQSAPITGVHTTAEARRRLSQRYASERRFQLYGIIAILISAGFLVLLLATIFRTGFPAFTAHYVDLEITLPAEKIDPDNTGDPAVIGRANYDAIIHNALRAKFPGVTERRQRRALNGLVTSGAGVRLRDNVMADPSLVGKTLIRPVLMSDTADNYLKGMVTKKRTIRPSSRASIVGGEMTDAGLVGEVRILSDANDFSVVLATIKESLAAQAQRRRDEAAGRQRSLGRLNENLAIAQERLAGAAAEDRALIEEQIKDLESDIAAVQAQYDSFMRQAELLEARATAPDEQEVADTNVPTFLVHMNGGTARIIASDTKSAVAQVMIPFDGPVEGVPAEDWDIVVIEKPEANRSITDREIVWLDALQAEGLVHRGLSEPFFTSGASREPELAGIWGAVVGSFWTMLVTLLLSFPVGVAAAIYLEEFAPKNRITHIIEVNINNLAAVPSIVYGLLGLSVFLNLFGLPRSAPVVGGMVIALMTLPTIIIAARAAIRAVPPSIREGALGMGASKMQATFDHVLPLAMPGILTGTIIGMAQALGETAPLLMIGMVAFIVSIPGGPMDAATVLPVQIYMWADFPEQAFTAKTSAAIIILLGFLVIMNAVAVVLRKRFERRW